MSSAALSPPSPCRFVGRLARLSPLFMGCVAAMGLAFVAGRNAREATTPAPSPLAVPAARPVAATADIPLRGALSDARDLECLTQAVYYEARGEPESGQAAVAQVVLNRTRAGRYPTSVCGVVFQHARALGRTGCQFSFACDRQTSRPREREAWARAERTARAALAGRHAAVLPTSTTQFRVAGLSSAGLERVAQIGAHVFYRLGHGVKRAPATLAAAPTIAVDPQPATTSEIHPNRPPLSPIIPAEAGTQAYAAPPPSPTIRR